MQDLQLMKRLQSPDHLNNNLPNMLLFHKLLVVLTFTDPLEYIPVIRILHHNATQVLEKGEINLPEG